MNLPIVLMATHGDGYLVASRSHPGAYWLVTYNGSSVECSCPATVSVCRHMRLAGEYCAAKSVAERRPEMPANVSALVD